MEKGTAKVCNKCGNPGTLRCSKCKKVYYCSKECQKSDWKTHKLSCSTSQNDDKPTPP